MVDKTEKRRIIEYISTFGETYCFYFDETDFQEIEEFKEFLADGYRDFDKINIFESDFYKGMNPVLNSFFIQYNSENILKNLFRLSLKDSLSQFIKNIDLLNAHLLKKLALLVNRPLYLNFSSLENSEKGLTLLAEFMVGYSEFLCECSERLKEIQVDLDKFSIPIDSYFPLCDGFHVKMAENLGFSASTSQNIGLLEEDEYISDITSIFRRLIKRMRYVHSQIGNYCEGMSLYNSSNLVDELEEAIIGVDHIKLVNFSNFQRIEQKRIKIFTFFKNISDNLLNLQTFYGRFFKKIPLDQNLIPEIGFLERPFTQYLLQHNFKPNEALAACQELFKYCKINNIPPKEMVEEELPLIHPKLNSCHLGYFKMSTKSFLDVKNQSSRQKEVVLERSKTLIRQLSEKLVLLLIFSVGLGIFSGCGVKTAPRASLDSLRPTIPFKSHNKNNKK